MYLGLGTRIGSSRTSATIQVTTPAYLDPTLLLVGEQIGDAYVAGVYPDFQGNAVSEASVTYYVDGGVVLSTYVLQAGDAVGAAYVSLTAGSATYAYWAEPTDVTDFSLSTADFTFVVPPGVGGPVLSSPVDTAHGGAAANGSVSTDTGNGTLYWVVTTSVTSPSSARVKAGQDHNGIAADDSGSQVVSGTGVQNLSPAPSGLTSETTYYIHFMHENASAVQSAVASGDGFTTADVTAPTLSSPTDAANGSTAATGSVSTNEGNGTLYWVVSTSGTAPSAAQVKAGNDHTGSAAADSGSQAVSGTGVQTLSPAPSGLTASTAYTIHFMHEDAAANQSSVASGDGFTTSAAGITGHDTVHRVESTSTAGSYNFTLTGITSGQIIHLPVKVLSDGNIQTPNSWTVTLNSVTATPVVWIANASSGVFPAIGVFRVQADATGDLALAITPSASCRACSVDARYLNGVNTTTPVVGTPSAPNSLNSDVTTINSPSGYAPQAAGNVILTDISIKGGDITGLVATSGADGHVTDATGANATSDITDGAAYNVAPDTSAITIDWDWTGADRVASTNVEYQPA